MQYGRGLQPFYFTLEQLTGIHAIGAAAGTAVVVARKPAETVAAKAATATVTVRAKCFSLG